MSLMIFKTRIHGDMSFRIILIVLIRPGSKQNGQTLTSKAKMFLCLRHLKIKVTIMAIMRTTTVMVILKATLVIVVLITTTKHRLCLCRTYHACRNTRSMCIRVVMEEDTANRQAATWPKGSKARHIMAGMCECDLVVIVSNYRQDRQETTSRLATKQTNSGPSANHSRQIFLVSYIKQYQTLACSRL